MSFRHRIVVQFGECDPAGILYYPRYFDLFHRTMEAWFSEALGLPYGPFIRERKLGVPSVRAEAEYRAPSTFGERLDVLLSVTELGRSSIVFGYEVSGPDGEERARGAVTCVLMDLDPSSTRFRRAVPIEGDLRERIEAFRSGV